MMNEKESELMEISALLAGIHERYGYDFSRYSFASLKRRLHRARDQARLASYGELLTAVTKSEQQFDEFLKHMSVSVTEMFRDPLFFKEVREHIVPLLKTYPFAKIWHAGCATGEEVYAMAVLLHEEGFLDRAQIYATDFNKHALKMAEQGIYATKYMKDYEKNYAEAGGGGNFSDYYYDGYERSKLREFLKERIIFSYHNLVTDGVFGEMNLICCRNVLIYFDQSLQNRTLSLFTESLRHGGFLCLGTKESLRFSGVESLYEPVSLRQRIYKKSGGAYV